ncbi:MAG: short-subunit dehydrogenase [Cellvibrionaceae bacterium]|jgi:short-subunit dehydrogenase
MAEFLFFGRSPPIWLLISGTSMHKKAALITGGSSGIGFEMSKYFARDGYHILWVSLVADELEQAKAKLEGLVSGVKIDTLNLDLANAQSPQKTYDWCKGNNWVVDVLINNAGFAEYGFANQTDVGKEVAMIELNVMAVFKLTKLFLQDMVARDAGTIINISSNTSFQPVPKLATYAATKAFVSHFSQSLQEEMRMQEKKVRVMTVCPAAIANTNFKSAANMHRVKTFDGLATTTAEEVAKDVWYGFKNGKTFVVSGARMRVLYALRNWVPYRLQQFMVRQELKESGSLGIQGVDPRCRG